LRTTIRGIEVPTQGDAAYDVRVLRQGGGEYELSPVQDTDGQ
jgi:hypothetical protein